MNGLPGFAKLLLYVQGIYTLVTALWAIVDIHTFMSVTGPKTDIWLVKTVASILVPIALFLLANFTGLGLSCIC